jgi:membrane protein DedA with SNARE-associated domain
VRDRGEDPMREGPTGTPVGLRRRLPPTRLVILRVVGLTLLLLVVAFLEGDVPEGFADVRIFVRDFLARFGVPGSLTLLYLEESGVPLPVPGDVYVLYLGHAAAGSLGKWVAAWLAIVAVVVAGSTNMYLISRRWGERLLRGRLGAALHVDAAALVRAERWLDRWGPIVIIFGRHLPGFRIPITVAAGTFKVRYRVFAPSVAVSTAIWAGVWFLLEARFGRQVGRFANAHRWTYVVIAAVLLFAIVSLIVRAARAKPAVVTDPGQ